MGYRCRWQLNASGDLGRDDFVEKCEPISEEILEIFQRCEIEAYKKGDKVTSPKWHRITLNGETLGHVKYRMGGVFAAKERCPTDDALNTPFWHTSDPPFAKGVELLLSDKEH